MALFETAAAKAANDIRRLRTARAELESKRQAAADELSKLRATAGEKELEAVLGNGDKDLSYRRRLADLQVTADGLAAGKAAIGPRIQSAVRAWLAACAVALLKPIPALERELAAVTAAIAGHLRDACKAAGLPEGSFVRQTPEMENESEGTLGGRPILVGQVPMMQPGRDVILASQIAAIQQQAAALEGRPVTLAGDCAGATLAEILAAEAQDGFTGPLAAELEAWYRSADAAAEKAWSAESWGDTWQQSGMPMPPGWQPPARVTHYALAWSADGVIDPSRSRWQNVMLPAHLRPAVPVAPRRKPEPPPERQPDGKALHIGVTTIAS
jgi:hypothetical protein